MKGIEREIDRNGRLVIPMEFRKKLGVEFNSKVFVLLLNGEIVIRTQKSTCALCGENISANKRIPLCDNCISKVKEE